MRKVLGIAVVVGFLVGSSLASQQNRGAATTGEVKVIDMTAKKYDFTPEEIRVKKGTRVQLKVRALDRTHGFKVQLYPEGAEKERPPGLRFDLPPAKQDSDTHPKDASWKLEKDQEHIIEFVAEQPGIYAFKCSVFCGLGHMGMKGKLVVEE